MKEWLVLSLRRFLRNKVNSIINVGGLTLGMFAFLLITVYLRHEYSYDRFHVDQERIYRIIKDMVPSDSHYQGVMRGRQCGDPSLF